MGDWRIFPGEYMDSLRDGILLPPFDVEKVSFFFEPLLLWYGLLLNITSRVLLFELGKLVSDCDLRILSVLLCGLFVPCLTDGRGEEGDQGCLESKPVPFLDLFFFGRIGLSCNEFLPGLALGRILSVPALRSICLPAMLFL